MQAVNVATHLFAYEARRFSDETNKHSLAPRDSAVLPLQLMLKSYRTGHVRSNQMSEIDHVIIKDRKDTCDDRANRHSSELSNNVRNDSVLVRRFPMSTRCRTHKHSHG